VSATHTPWRSRSSRSSANAIGADHEHRHGVAGAPQPAAERQAVHVREADVEDDRVGRRRREPAKAVLGVLGELDLPAVRLQRGAEEVALAPVVFDDQDAGDVGAVVAHGATTASAPSARGARGPAVNRPG
jgi:hypothetical protein